MTAALPLKQILTVQMPYIRAVGAHDWQDTSLRELQDGRVCLFTVELLSLAFPRKPEGGENPDLEKKREKRAFRDRIFARESGFLP